MPPCPAGGSISAQLKQAYLPLVDHKTCSSSSWWGSTVKTTMVCGGGGAEAGCNVSLLLREQGIRKSWTLSNRKYYCKMGFLLTNGVMKKHKKDKEIQ